MSNMAPEEFKEELFSVMLDFIEDLPCGTEAIEDRMSMSSEEFHKLMEEL